MNAGAAPIAVVTGGSRGIGRAIALALADRGMAVALLARSKRELANVRKEIAVSGGVALAIPCDVSSAPSVTAAAKQVIAELGVPSLVVNNAGIAKRATVTEMTERSWDETMAVNLKGTFLVTRAFLPRMLKRKHGRFVHVASISSTLGTARMSAYCASKWGVVGFTKALAEELRGTGLETMAVMPGSVDTAMLQGSGFTAAMTPEDVAGTVVYLGMDAPAAMNGSAVEVFG